MDQPRPRARLRTLWAALGLLVLFALAWTPPASAHGGGWGWDQVISTRIDFPVKLSDGKWYQVAGYLYVSPFNIRHRTIQLLVHGATYDHEYWDPPPINGISYSYARDMARRGYVVLAIDQLGTGKSSKPDGDWFNLAEAANTVHQVAKYIRMAAPGGCTKLVYVGHSNGTVTSVYAQATYGDADGVVSTGWVHGFRGLPVDPSDPEVQAAIANPYISLGGPIREGLMYYNPGVASDPDMIAYDTAHMVSSMPRAQFLDLIGIHADITLGGPTHMTTLTKSQLVRVPVLVQAGDHDDLIAPASAALAPPGEAAFYPLAADFQLQVLTNVGHCVNTHFDHEQSWDGIDDWIQTMID